MLRLGPKEWFAALAHRASAANDSGTGVSAKDIICRVLRLGGSMNQKLAIIAQLLEPAGDIAGLIVNDFV